MVTKDAKLRISETAGLLDVISEPRVKYLRKHTLENKYLKTPTLELKTIKNRPRANCVDPAYALYKEMC